MCHRVGRQYWLAFPDKELLRFFALPSTKNFRLSTSKIFQNYYVMLKFALNKNPFLLIPILLQQFSE